MAKLYRVEIRYPRQGWVILYPDACGLKKGEAERIAKAQREHETYYARFGARVDPVRVISEDDAREYRAAREARNHV